MLRRNDAGVEIDLGCGMKVATGDFPVEGHAT
jgi:hypothetical protein